jgi:hypothetical protein
MCCAVDGPSDVQCRYVFYETTRQYRPCPSEKVNFNKLINILLIIKEYFSLRFIPTIHGNHDWDEEAEYGFHYHEVSVKEKIFSKTLIKSNG